MRISSKIFNMLDVVEKKKRSTKNLPHETFQKLAGMRGLSVKPGLGLRQTDAAECGV